ncbi:tyrosine-type recombinase/integrase [Streptobacillus moniliformis]|uniref:Integrase family protein n=1 Tax=Streptobacillus moniliformis (strain ATCC 14647 / DSM 12112 / NCTC 10651 / 9901) TaxID=519441 RepID=D1AV97_STRM9|nr:site-specific integrase [Streptobacillus moniliformis]ACZ01657.1 integrase family protein [Streptobacillus moniliformis DSM 12112]AVL43343.1 site-specific integrase [Streptobacillus moniliformis]QXW66330.1 site-specific integrase [Streptobacillus moniliformis]SQA13165.1 site-specific tyrosine recombinase XerC [Streptobacillus moniliformis]
MRRANGTGTITKLKGIRRKPYIIRAGSYYDINGKLIRKTIGTAKTLKEATEILNKYNAKVLKRENYEITLCDLFEHWKNSEHANNLETIETYKRYISDFSTIFEPIINEKFIFLEYNDYQSLLNSFPKTKGKNALTVLKWIYIYSIKNKITKENISVFLNSSNIVVRKIKREIFDDNIVKSLWLDYENNNSNEYVAIFLILFYTGMRTRDILNLKNQNIFLNERYFITGSKTKAGRNRKIPMHHLIFPIIKQHYSKEKEYLFENITSDNLRVKFKNKIYDLSQREYNNINLHSIRHTFITKMQRLKDVKASLIKTIVGHSHSNITDDVYTHYSVKDMRDAVNKLKY